MSQLKDFFDAERKRVFEPDAYFTQRVMARLNVGIKKFGIWEVLPSSARPVLALALMLVLCFIAVEMFIPQMPQRGMVESFLAPEQNADESFLYSGGDIPSRQ